MVLALTQTETVIAFVLGGTSLGSISGSVHLRVPAGLGSEGTQGEGVIGSVPHTTPHLGEGGRSVPRSGTGPRALSCFKGIPIRYVALGYGRHFGAIAASGEATLH